MITTRRYQDWPERLNIFINQRANQPFAWGSNDCCLFVCDEIVAITGIDPAAETYRGHYTTALGASRFINAAGGVEAIAETICQQQGFEECPLLFAQRGDPMLIDMLISGLPTSQDKADQVALGVCLGGNVAFVGPNGLVYHKLKDCRRAWRVL